MIVCCLRKLLPNYYVLARQSFSVALRKFISYGISVNWISLTRFSIRLHLSIRQVTDRIYFPSAIGQDFVCTLPPFPWTSKYTLLKQTKTNNAKEHNITAVSKSVSGLILFMSRPIIIHRTVTSLAWSLTRGPLLFGCSCASSMRDFAPLETKPDITGQSWTEGLKKLIRTFTHVSPACQKSSISRSIISGSTQSTW